MGHRARTARVVACVALAAAIGGCAALQGARLYASGTRALDAGDAARAVSDLERAADRVPGASEIWNHLGLAYAAAGDPARARAAWERAVEVDCDNAAAHENLMAADAREGASVESADGG